MRLSIPTRVLFLALLLFGSSARAEKDEFFVYEPRQRLAEELKRAAEGIGGARINQFGNKLIIYGSRSQRDAVLKLFGELDHELRNYTVSLRIASKGSVKRDASAIEMEGGVRKKSGVLNRNGGASVGVAGKDIAVSGTAESAESEDTGDTGHQVTVMDGGQARVYSDAGIFAKAVTVHMRAIGKSGAHLEIRELDSSAVGEQALVTEIDVPLGEWRTLGGVNVRNEGRSGELFGHAKRSTMSSRDVQVRVVLAPK